MRRPYLLLPALVVAALAAHASTRVSEPRGEAAQAADLATERAAASPANAAGQESAEDEDGAEGEEAAEEAAPGAGVAAAPAEKQGQGVTRRASPLESLKPYPARADLLSRARPGPDGRLRVDTPSGTRTLTIDPELQRALVRVLQTNATPHAAVVVMEPATGRVVAMAEYSAAQPEVRGLALRAAYPAASIFKMVTGSALLKKGVRPYTEECFHGGKRRLSLALLLDSARDRSCYSLAQAMGKSANVVFAKMTRKHLSAADLAREAELLGFNRPLSFEMPVEVSPAVIPTTAFALAETGAGFGDVYMSPLHGAVMTAAVANGGRWQDATLLEPLEGPVVAQASAVPAVPGSGASALVGLEAAGAQVVPAVLASGGLTGAQAWDGPGEVMTPAQALAMTDMLEETVTHGTARRVFRERGYGVEGAVGKTGTLADKSPFRDYSWFVGFAPRDNPRYVVSAVVANGPIWRIRAPYVAREALRLALERDGTAAAPVRAGRRPRGR
jgi:membrane peptidoglycan carboxypeptidase